MNDSVSATKEISASAETVWTMVSDVTRMGEWFPENEGGAWFGDATAARPGATFRAKNRVGKKSWSTVAAVVNAEPGRRFSFRVSTGPVKVADWSYTFESTPTGCRLTESWTDLRPGWFKPIARLGTGVGDRSAHNRTGMEQTLERLSAAAESGSQSS
jgi:uncharacterized protein YndB with AHSA1/START domain